MTAPLLVYMPQLEHTNQSSVDPTFFHEIGLPRKPSISVRFCSTNAMENASRFSVALKALDKSRLVIHHM